MIGTVTIGALYLSPIFTDETHIAAANSDEVDAFTFDLQGEYTFQGTVVLNGGEWVDVEIVAAESGERYEYYRNTGSESGGGGDDGFVQEAYQASDGTPVHFRYTYFDTEAGEEKLESVNESLGDETVVDVERSDDTLRFVTVDDNHSSVTNTITAGQSMILGSLRNTVAYETAGSENVYQPQTGWYEQPVGYFRVSEAAGTVEVKPDTKAIINADTKVQLATPDDYLDYRFSDTELKTFETNVEVNEEATVTEPEWVENTGAEQ